MSMSIADGIKTVRFYITTIISLIKKKLISLTINYYLLPMCNIDLINLNLKQFCFESI